VGASLAVYLPNRYTTAKRNLMGKNLIEAKAVDELTKGM
jgi:hypothetical protein